MKLILTALALALAASPAMARPKPLAKACGKIEVQRRFCFRAPCPQGLVLKNVNGSRKAYALRTDRDDRLRSELEALNGRRACVLGFWQPRDAFLVMNIDD